jgi:hypothetical protein
MPSEASKTHRHRCSNTACGLVWQHSPRGFAKDHVLNIVAHTCPNCGTTLNGRWWHYTGRIQASCIHPPLPKNPFLATNVRSLARSIGGI